MKKFFLFILIFSFLSHWAFASEGKQSVRIAILRGVAIIEFSVRGAYEIYDLKNNKRLKKGRGLKQVILATTAEGITIN